MKLWNYTTRLRGSLCHEPTQPDRSVIIREALHLIPAREEKVLLMGDFGESPLTCIKFQLWTYGYIMFGSDLWFSWGVRKTYRGSTVHIHTEKGWAEHIKAAACILSDFTRDQKSILCFILPPSIRPPLPPSICCHPLLFQTILY